MESRQPLLSGSSEAPDPPPDVRSRCGLFFRQQLILAQKNFFVWKGTLQNSLFELLIPILLGNLYIAIFVSINIQMTKGNKFDRDGHFPYLMNLRGIVYYTQPDQVDSRLTELISSIDRVRSSTMLAANRTELLRSIRTNYTGSTVGPSGLGIEFLVVDFDRGRLEYTIHSMTDSGQTQNNGKFGGEDWEDNPLHPDWTKVDVSVRVDEAELQATINNVFIDIIQLGSAGNETDHEAIALPSLMFPKSFLAQTFTKWMLFPVFAILIIVISFSKDVMNERITVLPMFMIMGMSHSTFLLSHLLFTYIRVSIILVFSMSIPLLYMSLIESFMLYIFLMVYAICISQLVLLVGQLAKTPSGVVIWTSCIWGVLVNLYGFQSSINGSTTSKFLSSLNFVSAGMMFLQSLYDHNVRYDKVNFSNMWGYGNYRFDCGWALLMLLVDSLMMLLIVMNLHKIKGRLSCMKVHENDGDLVELEEAIEKVEDGRKAEIDVSNLCKEFRNTAVVRDLNLKCYQGEVTVLLGHNGAGKTTTFNMICGAVEATSGKIVVSGRKVKSPRDLTRVGYCPQHNSLYDELTVLQHLQLVHALKGSEENFKKETDRLLMLLRISDKLHMKSKTLSGGQKRKLCIAMALIGGSSVVLLDEPTAGIDTSSRREVAHMIEKEKQNRTILMTTHYMDEAEMLGDRVAVMVKGKVVCQGSVDFLKNRFSDGYLLSVVFEDIPSAKQKSNDIKQLASRKQLDMKLTEIRGKQANYKINSNQKSKFPSFLSKLEKYQKQLNVDSFGLALSSLEQVFLKVGDLCDPTAAIDDDKTKERNEALGKLRNHRQQSFWSHINMKIQAILMKRYYYAIRNVALILEQYVVPLVLFILFALLTFLFSSASKTDGVSEEHEICSKCLHLDHTLLIVHLTENNSKIIDSIKQNLGPNAEIVEFFPNSSIQPYEDEVQMPDNAQELVAYTYRNIPRRMPPVVIALMVEDDDITVFFNADVKIALLTYQHVIDTVRLQSVIPNGKITTRLHDVRESSIYDYIGPAFFSMVASTIFAFAFVLIIGMYVSASTNFYIEERISMFLYQQLTTGVSDFILYGVSILFDIPVFVLYQLNFGFLIELNDSLVIPASEFFIVSSLFFLSTVFQSLVFSRMFKSKTLLSVLLLAFNLGGGLAAIMLSMAKADILFIAEYIEYVLMFLIPSYSAVCSLGLRYFPIIDNMKILDVASYGKCLAALSFIFLSNATIFILFEFRLIRKKLRRKPRGQLLPVTVDSEVERETSKMKEKGPNDILIVKDLVKFYGSLCAVNNISFCVPSNECYGLLGVNGAGKTSTFQILNGISFADQGSAKIDGVDCSERPAIGYCPQIDALLPTLTALETLIIICHLYGIPNAKAASMTVLAAVGLEDHANVLVKKCSGGQKRRISVGLALLAPAPILLLDEPTAGIDPKTRRIIWDALSYVRENTDTAIVLTSHSMEECEALCTKISIMMRSTIVVTGTSQSLKHKFANGFILTIHIKSLKAKMIVIDLVREMFGSSILKTSTDSHSLTLKWMIPREKSTKWSNLFYICNKRLNINEVKDFCITQCSLEDTFLQLIDAAQNFSPNTAPVLTIPLTSGSKDSTNATGSGEVCKGQNAPSKNTTSARKADEKSVKSEIKGKKSGTGSMKGLNVQSSLMGDAKMISESGE